MQLATYTPPPAYCPPRDRSVPVECPPLGFESVASHRHEWIEYERRDSERSRGA